VPALLAGKLQPSEVGWCGCVPCGCGLGVCGGGAVDLDGCKVWGLIARAHTHILIHKHTQIRTRASTHTHSCTRTHRYTHARAHTPTHAHARTHTRAGGCRCRRLCPHPHPRAPAGRSRVRLRRRAPPPLLPRPHCQRAVGAGHLALHPRPVAAGPRVRGAAARWVVLL